VQNNSGRVTDFKKYPLRLNFNVDKHRLNVARSFMEKNSAEELTLRCELAAGRALSMKKVMTVFFKQFEAQFGTGDDAVVVLQNQLTWLAEQLYEPLGVHTEFSLSADKFKELFAVSVVESLSNYVWSDILQTLPIIANSAGYDDENFAWTLDFLSNLFKVRPNEKGTPAVSVSEYNTTNEIEA
jgi:hypothetical protein